jgi:hypothetical protein
LRGLRKASVLMEHRPRVSQLEQRIRAVISSNVVSQLNIRASASGSMLRAWPQCWHVTVIRN